MVMQHILLSKLYKEQFDAIQDCFRIIGFTEEVGHHTAATAVMSGVKERGGGMYPATFNLASFIPQETDLYI